MGKVKFFGVSAKAKMSFCIQVCKLIFFPLSVTGFFLSLRNTPEMYFSLFPLIFVEAKFSWQVPNLNHLLLSPCSCILMRRESVASTIISIPSSTLNNKIIHLFHAVFQVQQWGAGWAHQLCQLRGGNPGGELWHSLWLQLCHALRTLLVGPFNRAVRHHTLALFQLQHLTEKITTNGICLKESCSKN